MVHAVYGGGKRTEAVWVLMGSGSGSGSEAVMEDHSVGVYSWM